MKPAEMICLPTFVLLFMYIVYAVIAYRLPWQVWFIFTLFGAAVGLITYGITPSIWMALAMTTVAAALIIFINTFKMKECFMDGNPVEIAARLKKVERVQEKAPVGVYASGYVEAFEDISENKVETGTSAESKPAPAATTTQAAAATTTKSGFKDASAPSQDGLFKLGVLPEETKGGFHIDQGTTVLNALDALKPDEVKRMSEDTQKLIDTQKSLMAMLGTMKPMLTDGKQLIDTFQQMFGPAGSQTMPQMST
jgi:hypothetical protein